MFVHGLNDSLEVRSVRLLIPPHVAAANRNSRYMVRNPAGLGAAVLRKGPVWAGFHAFNSHARDLDRVVDESLLDKNHRARRRLDRTNSIEQ